MTRDRSALIVAFIMIGISALCCFLILAGLLFNSLLARQSTSQTTLVIPLRTLETRAAEISDTSPSLTYTPFPTWTSDQPLSTQSPAIISTPTPILTQSVAPSPPAPQATPLIPTNTVGPIVFDSWCIPWQTERSQGTVTRVIDGITIEVETEAGIVPVRYIGLSLASESLYPNSSISAKEANQKLVDGQKVLMVKDRSEIDEGGNLLRYVIADGVFVNQNLIYEGYAQANIIPPDTSCSNTLLEAETSAMVNHRGIYTPLATATRAIVLNPTPTIHTLGDIMITLIQPLGDGWQDPNEFIEFKNNSSHPIQMQDWIIKDLKGHTFKFPYFIINSGNYCRVYTNAYHPVHCGLSFYSLSPIWDDTEECAYLYNPIGGLVDEFCYGW